MIPIPIPDSLITTDRDHLDLSIPGTLKRVVIGPPDGDPTGDIRPVESLVGHDPERGLIYTMLVALQPGEIERLIEMRDHGLEPAVWLSLNTDQISPFSLEIADGRG